MDDADAGKRGTGAAAEANLFFSFFLRLTETSLFEWISTKNYLLTLAPVDPNRAANKTVNY